MKAQETIRKFLIDNKIEFSEVHDSFILADSGIVLQSEKIMYLDVKQWSIIAMEIGLKTIGTLIKDLKKCEGAEVYEFRKKNAESIS